MKNIIMCEWIMCNYNFKKKHKSQHPCSLSVCVFFGRRAPPLPFFAWHKNSADYFSYLRRHISVACTALWSQNAVLYNIDVILCTPNLSCMGLTCMCSSARIRTLFRRFGTFFFIFLIISRI